MRSQLYPNLPPGLFAQGDPGVPDKVIPSNYKLFDPRVGFAFDPFGDGKSSIRGGFAIYQYQMMGNNFHPNYIPFDIATSFPFPFSIEDPYKGQVNPFSGVTGRPNPSNVMPVLPMVANPMTFGMKVPTFQQWNFTIERQLPWASLVRVAYEGQEAYHLYGDVEANPAVYNPSLSATDNRKTVNQRRPMGQNFQSLALGITEATSSFNALVVSVEKRMTHGVTFLTGYRWSKCLNEGDVQNFNAPYYISPSIGFDRGPCTYDIAHQFKLSYVWQIPTVKSLGLVGRQVLGGWETTGILYLRDGLPYTVISGIDNSLSGIGMDRADVVGDPALPGDRPKAQKLQQWFNTQAFVVNALGTYGTSSRNMLVGPGFADFDLSVNRVFPIRKGPLAETQSLQFRAEFFNLFNRANFGNPVATVTSSTFGRVLSAGDPRIIQLGLKFVY